MIEIVAIICGGDGMREMWILRQPNVLDKTQYEWRVSFNPLDED